ncbi:hypothetical protein GCM10009112_27870 [Marinomonas arenicola]|uniref:winged helix-turn-helix domain-containing protein n=1 Tax=Marinomonas TaxID=28253 RepID=UPI001AA001DA|nr:winged helix-turn-helix domain-containing protein [Marinomonas sp. KMM3893]
MIPNYQDCMRPFLLALQQSTTNEVKLRDVINNIAEHFDLTDAERIEPLPSGKQPILLKRALSIAHAVRTLLLLIVALLL